MISSIEKAIIISAAMYSSSYLFAVSLRHMNISVLNGNSVLYDINSTIMFCSAASFGYFTYIAIN